MGVSMKKTMWLPVSVLAFLAILPASIIGQTSYALVATFAAPKPVTAAYFGNAVRIGTDRVAVAAPMDKVGETAQAGAAYVFDLSGKLLLTLVSPSPKQKAGFGGDQWNSNPLAIDGDLVVVGEALAAGGGYGVTAATDGTVVAIGAPAAGGDGGTGKVYLYSATGKYLKTILPPDAASGAGFGIAVAMDSGRIVVGASGAAYKGLKGAGRVFIYDSAGNLLSSLAAPKPAEYAAFGCSVDMKGDLVLVGASSEVVSEMADAGRAYLFRAKR